MIRTIEVLGEVRASTERAAKTSFKGEVTLKLQTILKDYSIDEVEVEDGPDDGLYPMRLVLRSDDE